MPARCTQPCASFALTHWNSPVSTGYSMYLTCASAWPALSIQDVLYGNMPGWSSRSAVYSGTMSE